jgi:hypothetical protein
LHLCRESAVILFAEIHHIPGAKNKISDLMSIAHKDIPSILEDNKEKNILTEKNLQKFSIV